MGDLGFGVKETWVRFQLSFADDLSRVIRYLERQVKFEFPDKDFSILSYVPSNVFLIFNYLGESIVFFFC